ncbi:MAG TPA: hypothetical protein VMD05_06775 [Candidatus Nanoarchaeia archaeon]|nr:hypothetical protein [Candidatus Nanoarchaeia archaeon]
MISLSTLLGFVIGVVRCPWGTWRSLKSLVQYAADTINKPGKVNIRDAQWTKLSDTPVKSVS